MGSYLSRIYRRGKKDPKEVVGVVEEIETGLNCAFQGMTDSCEILTLEKFSSKKPFDTKRSHREDHIQSD